MCICLGMQLLASEGFEEKPTKGLNFIPNKVRKFNFKETKNKIPHVGFNQVFLKKKISYLKDCNQEQIFTLFTLIEYCPKMSDNISKTNYGIDFYVFFY